AYFAPEQARGERADERSDIYSLGAILFEMLTGHLVFDADNPAEMIAHHLGTPAPSPRQYVSNVPDALERIVARCLRKTREERYASVTQLLVDLEEHLGSRRIGLGQLRSGRAPDPPPAPPVPTAPPAQPAAPTPPGGWNPAPPPKLDMDRQPWMDILHALPSRQADANEVIAEHEPPPRSRPVAVPPVVNPWDLQAPAESPMAASESWLQEASWGKFDQIAGRMRKDDPLRSVQEVLESPTETVECKRCHATNPAERKYCVECAGLLVASPQRLQQEAREMTELGIMYYKQGQLGDARREFTAALERVSDLFEARLYLGRIELDEHHLEESERELRHAAVANDQDARPYMFLAELYKEQGRKKEAVAAYRAALAIDPRDAETRCRLAFLLSNLHQIDEAIAEYRTVVDMVPEHLEAYKQLGIIYAGQDLIDESIAAFEALGKLDPQNQQAFRWLARLYHRRKRYSHAERAYHTALSLEPHDAELYAQLGSVYESQHKEDAALKALRQSIQLDAGNLEARTRLASLYLTHNQPRQAIQELEQACVYHPQSATVHRYLGELYLDQNNLDRALSHFEQAVALNPMAAEAHSNLGKVYLKKDLDSGAMVHYQQAVSIEPYNPVYREELGLAYYAQGQKDLAVQELRKASMLDSTNVDYLKALGLICESADRLDEAVQSLQKALELAPRDAMARGLLGKVYLRQGLAHFAIQELQRAVDAEPGNLLLQIYVARAYSQIGQPQLAIKHFKNAIELGGTEGRETRKFMAQSYQDLAKAYLDSGQYRKAAEVLDASLQVLPDHPRSLHYRALAALGLDDIAQARELLGQALSKEPQNAEMYFSLGRLHDKLGEPSQALRAYRQACKLAPSRLEFLEGLANHLASQRQYGEAAQVLDVALKLRPARAAIYYGMRGGWLLDQGLLEPAVDELRRAVAKGSDQVQHYLKLSQALTDLGRLQDAKQVLKDAGANFAGEDDRTALTEALKRLRK
ncbi:MAG TPA: tetratricopeptide repeat protein, partial [Candidatus Xenobia bacterium]